MYKTETAAMAWLPKRRGGRIRIHKTETGTSQGNGSTLSQGKDDQLESYTKSKNSLSRQETGSQAKGTEYEGKEMAV